MNRIHLLALVSLLSGCAVAPAFSDEEGTSESGIVGGVDSASDTAVVDIVHGATLSSMPGRCTGTIIAPRVVLTAGHCVVSHDAGEPSPRAWAVFTGADEKGKGTILEVERAVAHPEWIAGRENGFDVAVLVLAEKTSIAPARMNRSALGKSFVGTTVRAVGYGSDDASSETTTGKRMAVSVRVDAVSARELTLRTAGSTTCHGDSGGPLLGRVGGRSVVVGVISRGDCEEVSISTRVDAVTAFVDPVVRSAS